MRIAKLKIDAAIVKDYIEVYQEVFGELKFVPFKVEHIYHEDVFEMVGCSPRFADVEEGSKLNEYELRLIINPKQRVLLDYKVVRVDGE
jgi:hypothetical protein